MQDLKNMFSVKLTGISKAMKCSTSVDYDIFTSILFATCKNISFSFLPCYTTCTKYNVHTYTRTEKL